MKELFTRATVDLITWLLSDRTSHLSSKTPTTKYLMATSTRLFPVLGIACLIGLILIYVGLSEHNGLGLSIDFPLRTDSTPSAETDEMNTVPATLSSARRLQILSQQSSETGRNLSSSSRLVVFTKTKEENTSWIDEELPGLEHLIYVADDMEAEHHPPKNKGHEVMIYLSYIIDHYHDLPDVVLFMHAHRWSYHNNELQGADAVRLIQSLSLERVRREGYLNVRCHWDPGCPGHLHPLSTVMDFHQLQGVMAEKWPELFPSDPIPETLSQPCCAQFAVSRERIQAIDLKDFIWYRDWLFRTPLTDYYSGRLWEYLWHFVFTGQTILCPAEHVCYCDGYGYCFGGQEPYLEWLSIRDQRTKFGDELAEWRKKDDGWKAALEKGEDLTVLGMEPPEVGRDVFLRDQVDALDKELEERKAAALERGRDPRNRAVEAGREWKEGDGF